MGARAILLLVGAVTAGMHAYYATRVEVDLRQEVVEQGPQRWWLSEDSLQQLGRVARLIHWGGLALGGIFLVCGVLVRAYPVPVTVLGLVLYLGGTAIFGVMNPTTLWQGVVVKLVFIVGLFKAMREAVAQQTERTAAR